VKDEGIQLEDESREDSDNLPAPGMLATEIVEDLQEALEQFRLIAEDLGGTGPEFHRSNRLYQRYFFLNGV
jgi:hypothetical protein